MKLEPLSLQDVETIRRWRNQEMECWRTSHMLTKEMQEDFYKRCCDRNSNHRYWAIVDDTAKAKHMNYPLIGMGGITYIQWENRIGEITLIIDPEKRKCGTGEVAVDLLLDVGFNHLNLQTIFGECYKCNPAWEFWQKIVRIYNDGCGYEGILPNRKYWQGNYYDSLYFSTDKDDFNKLHSTKEHVRPIKEEDIGQLVKMKQDQMKELEELLPGEKCDSGFKNLDGKIVSFNHVV